MSGHYDDNQQANGAMQTSQNHRSSLGPNLIGNEMGRDNILAHPIDGLSVPPISTIGLHVPRYDASFPGSLPAPTFVTPHAMGDSSSSRRVALAPPEDDDQQVIAARYSHLFKLSWNCIMYAQENDTATAELMSELDQFISTHQQHPRYN
ncbi:hypothetical protein J8273_2320 [Carpediemonas membranifera]|uniref:Uncharacterized protein n=1 Tax=Carpediemonas membranifera TaxID=201153 RepID=A0A8J6AVP7_9EUKA|nr:hypothetical protein J8273_2320 [Carpediemonas membranifera]|eukprot:KAG9395971.1 hypothetical protein J8273_2320 [Carpediemonas membranifera]